MFNNILFVCSGNICRSPFAAGYFKQRFPKADIQSYGLLVERSQLSGHQAAAQAINIGKEFGVDLSQHRAQQLHEAHLDASDLILVMTRAQQERVCEMLPTCRHKTFLLGQLTHSSEINDPFQMDDDTFRACFSHIASSVDRWQDKLT